MAIDIVIQQKGPVKTPLTEAELSPAGLRAGHWNQAGVLDPGPAGDGRVLCDPRQPGRGCFLRAVPGEREEISLRQPLPCTPRDHELFYTLVRDLCRFWRTDRFLQDGKERHIEEIPQLLEYQNHAAVGLLRSVAEQWQRDGEALVTGAVYPLYLEPEIVARLKGGDLPFFQQCLAEKQQGDRYYAKPSFYQKKNGPGVLGMYAVTEGVETVLPLRPFVPPLYAILLRDFRLATEQVTEWRVSLNRVWEEEGEMKGETLGYVPYDQFARRVNLDRRPPFDAKHAVVTVNDLAEALE